MTASMWDRAGILKTRRALQTCTAPTAAGAELIEVLLYRCLTLRDGLRAWQFYLSRTHSGSSS
eukprot:3700664-Pleurochrysis_carterae.AAC.1